jgi:thymidylate synthase (FAD)
MGVAKEVARTILPEGMTPSRLYMAGTLRSWVHYCALRCAPGTQLEHQHVAASCWSIVLDYFPSLADAIEWVVVTEDA